MPELTTTTATLLGLFASGTLLHGVAMWATHRRTRGNRDNRGNRVSPDFVIEPPGLSLLKPVKGLEDGLDANLRSFFSQAYQGPLEIIFCAEREDDPAMVLARRLAPDYPDVSVEFVVADGRFGENPKVNNMQAGFERAKHPYVLQSDANVRLPGGYLNDLMRFALTTDADMVGSLVVGDGERSFGSLLENLQLTAFVAPAVCIAKEVADIPCVIGKSMLLRRAALQSIGGLAVVRNVLAEDFILAETFQDAGFRVELSPLVVANINSRTTVRQFLARHARWLKMRAVIHLPAHLADPFANPTLFTLLAAAFSGFEPAWVALHGLALTYKCQCDRWLLHRLRGHAPALLALLPATQLRDLLIPATWLYASFSRTTVWRGRTLRIGRGSRLIPRDADATGLSNLDLGPEQLPAAKTSH